MPMYVDIDNFFNVYYIVLEKCMIKGKPEERIYEYMNRKWFITELDSWPLTTVYRILFFLLFPAQTTEASSSELMRKIIEIIRHRNW